MAVRIGGTLGEASMTSQAKAEEPLLYGCTDLQRRCWIDVNEYMRKHGCGVSLAIKECGYTPPVYYAVKKKVQASHGEALSPTAFRDSEKIRPTDAVVKNVRIAEQQEEDRRVQGTPPPLFRLDAVQSVPTTEDRRFDCEIAISKPKTRPERTYADKLKLYDSVQVEMTHSDIDEENACSNLGATFVDYLEAKADVEPVLAKEAEEKRKAETATPKLQAWESAMDSSMRKALDVLTKHMQAATLEGSPLAAPTDPMKVLVTAMRLLEPLPAEGRASVIRGLTSFYGVAQ